MSTVSGMLYKKVITLPRICKIIHAVITNNKLSKDYEIKHWNALTVDQLMET